MKIEINGIKTPINSIQADIGFDSNSLEVVDISTKDSFASVFIQKEINNKVGYARLVGGLPNPGFSSDHGLFGTIYFKGKSPTFTQIAFLPSSFVLANDGRGSNVLKDYVTVAYIILPEKITVAEENRQKSMVMESTVLGAHTQNPENTQITFFDDNNVLGTESNSNIPQTKKPDIDNDFTSLFLNLLSMIDTFIISLYQKLPLQKL